MMSLSRVFVAILVVLLFFYHYNSYFQKKPTCTTFKNKETCDEQTSCVWCTSYAVPSGCYNLEDAKNLPNPVFLCDKTVSQIEVVTIPNVLREPLTVSLQAKVHTVDDDKICDKVNQISGYFNIGNSGKKYFFWFFESRSNPKSDPLVMWLTGGPGCSSEIALFGENGPCTIDGSNTKSNKYSWNSKANLLYVDQPSGTGFSYGDEDSTHNEKDVSRDLYLFVTSFLRKYPAYQNLPFFLFGESYAGHYVPASAHRFWLGNKNKESDIVINLKGVSVGNGMTNPLLQFPLFPEMAYNFSKTQRVISKSVYLEMERAVPYCTSLIYLCNKLGGHSCLTALEFCENTLIFPVQAEGWNQYDLREKCGKPPLCYDFSDIASYLNRADIRQKLGVPQNIVWQECSGAVGRRFRKDWMHIFDFMIPDLLNDDIPVLIYAGETDYICNWMGNKKWVLELKWKQSAEFKAAKDVDWNKGGGLIRRVGAFSFLQVKNAGHMVPRDQPKNALDMLNQFIYKQSPFFTEV